MNITTLCRNEVEKHTLEKLDWGFRFLVGDELTAMRIGYAYRNSPHGYLIEWADGAEKFSVTIWNELAEKIGFTVRQGPPANRES